MLNARLTRVAAIVSGFLLATASEAAATYVVGCVISPIGNFTQVVMRNTTGVTIHAGSTIKYMVCSRTSFGFGKPTPDGRWCVHRALILRDDFLPGKTMELFSGEHGLLSCAATVALAQEKVRKPEIPQYSRSRPPGPPGPGILESSPGTTQQGPSGIGTAKPSAPPLWKSR